MNKKGFNMYKNGLFITTFLQKIINVPVAEKWKERVFEYTRRFEMDSEKSTFIIDEIQCLIINNLDELSFPLCFREVQKLENIVSKTSFSKETRIYERFHLLHYVIFEELSNK